MVEVVATEQSEKFGSGSELVEVSLICSSLKDFRYLSFADVKDKFVRSEALIAEQKALFCGTESVTVVDDDHFLFENSLMFVNATLRLWDDGELRKWLCSKISNKAAETSALVRSLVMPHKNSNNKDTVVFVNFSFATNEDAVDFKVNYSTRLARYLLQQGTSPQEIVIAAVGDSNVKRIRENASRILGQEYGIKITGLESIDRSHETIIISAAHSSRELPNYIDFAIFNSFVVSRSADSYLS